MTRGNFMLYYLRDGRNKSALSRFTSKGAIISRLLSFFRKRRLLYESKTFEIVASHPSLRALFRARGKAGAWADKEIVCNCNVCKRLPHPNGARLWRITILRTRRFPTVFLRSGFFYTRTPTENSVGGYVWNFTKRRFRPFRHSAKSCRPQSGAFRCNNTALRKLNRHCQNLYEYFPIPALCLCNKHLLNHRNK